MILSKLEIQQITKILKRQNRFIWNDNIILKVIEILNQLREGQIKRSDFFIFSILTYEDYIYNLHLNKFL